MYSISGDRQTAAALGPASAGPSVAFPSSEGKARSEMVRPSPDVGRYQCILSFMNPGLFVSVRLQYFPESVVRQPPQGGRKGFAPAADLAAIEREHIGVEQPARQLGRLGPGDAEELEDPVQRR